MQLEQQISGSEPPELAKWVEWRKIVKENRQKATVSNKQANN